MSPITPINSDMKAIFDRAINLVQATIQQVCSWVDLHESSLTQDQRADWMAVIGILRGFITVLQTTLVSVIKQQTTQHKAISSFATVEREVLELQRQIALITNPLNSV